MPKIGPTLEHTINKIKKHKTICFVAGRSGGHLLPAITLAQQHKEKYPNDQIVFITTATTIDKIILSKYRFIHIHEVLNIGNIPKSIWHYPSYSFKLIIAILKCIRILKKQSVTKVINTGGYVLLPIAIASKLFAIPINVYELNALPGKAVKILAPLISSIHICFKTTQQFLPKQKCILGTYPLKFKNEDKITQKDAVAQLKLASNRKTILVLGGSQGSLFINNIIKNWLEKNANLHTKLQIIHQTGANDETNWQTFYEDNNIPAMVFSFTHQLAYYYNAADLIICRSGAGTLFEAAFFNKPCITIPLETKNTDHQRLNALVMHEQYPDIISILTQVELKNNPSRLTQAITKHLNW